MAVAAGGPGRHGSEHPSGDAAVTLTAPVYNLANALTAARLVAALPIVLFIQAGNWGAAFTIFVLAALTDVADGWVAKRYAGRSSVGAFLDPMADKLLVAGACVALSRAGEMPLWFTGMVVGRDLLIVVGTLIVRSRVAAFKVVPLAVGKLTTFAQLVTVGVMLGGLAGVADVGTALRILVPVTTALMIVSSVAYLAAAFKVAGPSGARA